MTLYINKYIEHYKIKKAKKGQADDVKNIFIEKKKMMSKTTKTLTMVKHLCPENKELLTMVKELRLH